MILLQYLLTGSSHLLVLLKPTWYQGWRFPYVLQGDIHPYTELEVHLLKIPCEAFKHTHIVLYILEQ